MKKIHTQAKRAFKLSTHLKHYRYFHKLGKKLRPRTFTSEERANEWASENNIAKYTLIKVKKDKRFQIVEMQNGQS